MNKVKVLKECNYNLATSSSPSNGLVEYPNSFFEKCLSTGKKYKETENSHTLLTSREIDVVNWVLNGKTAKETAKQLFISPRTVERHLENIRFKLSCRNKMELINKVLAQSSSFLQSARN